MPDIKILDRKGELKVLSEARLQEWRKSFRGTIFQAVDDGYDDARKVWNGLIDHHPALIACCAGPEDVVTAVDFARDNNLLLSVRAGGHNVSGAAVADRGLTIDLSAMRKVTVDAQHKIARVEGGALLGDIDRQTHKFNLAAPLGIVSQAGVAGLTLHGGVGWQVRKHGLTIDNLEAVEIVTAAGRMMRASAHENQELFWAIRGGGGNFGVVTSFEFRLHRLGQQVMMSAPIYPLARAAEVMTFCRDYMAEAPEELMVIGTCCTAPHIEAVSAEHYGQPVVMLLGCYAGDPAEGREVIQPLCSITEPIADLSVQMDWLEAQQFLHKDYPDGACYYWKSIFLNRFDEDVIAALAYHTANRPSLESSIDVWFLGEAMARNPDDPTPLQRRDAPFMANVKANWHDPEEAELNIAWARAAYYDLRRFSDGSSYLNFPGFIEDGEKMLEAAYGPNLPGLMKVKNQYDPDNLFPGLLNIAPRRDESPGT